MPPLAKEAAHAAYWAARPKPASRAEWVDDYATALGKIRPGVALSDAYAAGFTAYERQGKINPRLAMLADAMLGPL